MTDDLKSGPYDQDDGHRAGCDRRPCMCPPRSTTAQLDRDLLHTGEARAEVTDQGLVRIPPIGIIIPEHARQHIDQARADMKAMWAELDKSHPDPAPEQPGRLRRAWRWLTSSTVRRAWADREGLCPWCYRPLPTGVACDACAPLQR